MLINNIKSKSTSGAAIVLLAISGTADASGKSVEAPQVPPLYEAEVGASKVGGSATAANVIANSRIDALISRAATAALGQSGMGRIMEFSQLDSGWDGVNSSPLDLVSVVHFSSFFEKTKIKPDGMAVFMSGRGNIVVNWISKKAGMVELEFSPEGTHYFLESTSTEGVLRAEDIGPSTINLFMSQHG